MGILSNADVTVADKLEMSCDGNYTIHGDGMFDDLMEAVTMHLTAQYKLGRVTGVEYANVLTASIEASMSNSVNYVLNKLNPDKTLAEIELIEKQKEKIDAEILIANAQVLKIQAEEALLKQKLLTEKMQLELLRAQVELAKEQGKGFFWAAKKNWAKLTVDAASVDATQGEGFTDALSNSVSERRDSEPKPDGGTTG